MNCVPIVLFFVLLTLCIANSDADSITADCCKGYGVDCEHIEANKTCKCGEIIHDSCSAEISNPGFDNDINVKTEDDTIDEQHPIPCCEDYKRFGDKCYKTCEVSDEYCEICTAEKYCACNTTKPVEYKMTNGTIGKENILCEKHEPDCPKNNGPTLFNNTLVQPNNNNNNPIANKTNTILQPQSGNSSAIPDTKTNTTSSTNATSSAMDITTSNKLTAAAMVLIAGAASYIIV